MIIYFCTILSYIMLAVYKLTNMKLVLYFPFTFSK